MIFYQFLYSMLLYIYFVHKIVGTLPESPFVSPCECAIIYDCSCIDKSMQIVLKRDSIDKPLIFNICLLHTTNFSY